VAVLEGATVEKVDGKDVVEEEKKRNKKKDGATRRRVAMADN